MSWHCGSLYLNSNVQPMLKTKQKNKEKLPYWRLPHRQNKTELHTDRCFVFTSQIQVLSHCSLATAHTVQPVSDPDSTTKGGGNNSLSTFWTFAWNFTTRITNDISQHWHLTTPLARDKHASCKLHRLQTKAWVYGAQDGREACNAAQKKLDIWSG